jgi:hypothetical protein
LGTDVVLSQNPWRSFGKLSPNLPRKDQIRIDPKKTKWNISTKQWSVPRWLSQHYQALNLLLRREISKLCMLHLMQRGYKNKKRLKRGSLMERCMAVPKLRLTDRYQGCISKDRECMEDLKLQDLARPRQADHQSETLPTALQERMDLIGLASLDCATIVSRQIISFEIATNRAIFFVTLLSRSRATQNRFVKSCLKCVCKLKMPASLTKTKNSSHSLPKLKTAKKLDRKETMLTPITFSLLILQTSERDPPVRDFTMQSNVRIFRWRQHLSSVFDVHTSTHRRCYQEEKAKR